MGKKQKNKSEDSTKDDTDLGALAAEIEGAGAAKEQEPQKGKGKKKKEKKKQDFDENDILRELEELSLEAQGIGADRDAATVKPTENNEEESASKQDKKKKGQKGKKTSFDENDSEELEDKDSKSKSLPDLTQRCSSLGVRMQMILINFLKKVKKPRNQLKNGMGRKRMKTIAKEVKNVRE